MMKASTATIPSHHLLFAHSNFGLDTLQSKIFTLLLESVPTYQQMLPLRIRIGEVLGTNPSQVHYTLLEDALDGLASKRLRNPGPNRHSATFLPIFQYVTFSDQEDGYIEVLFSELVKEALEELTTNFSIKEIAKFVQLRHSHTQRLFWFLRSYVNERKVEISVDELKDVVLGVRKYRQKDAEYERYYDFKTRVVDQAIKAIRDKGLLDIRYREHRHKRVVEKLILKVNYCTPGQPKTEDTQQLVLF